jgi:uncharacterized protein YjbI with pentapeptide repeats
MTKPSRAQPLAATRQDAGGKQRIREEFRAIRPWRGGRVFGSVRSIAAHIVAEFGAVRCPGEEAIAYDICCSRLQHAESAGRFVAVREIARLPEGRAPQEPYDLQRERERVRRVTAVLGWLGLFAVLLPIARSEGSAQNELRSRRFEHSQEGPAVARVFFRLWQWDYPRAFLKIMALAGLVFIVSEGWRNYLYRHLVRAGQRIDVRFPHIEAVRRLFSVFAEFQPSVAHLDLRGADLSNMYLGGANLATTDLSHANLASSYLARADLSHSNLDDVNLNNSTLRAAALTKVTARRAQASEASFVNADFSGGNWEAANFENAILDGAVIERANLRLVNLRGASLVGTRIVNCDLHQADLTGADLRHADFVECDVTAITLREASVYGTAAWGLVGKPADSTNLVITPEGEPEVVVDDLEVAQLLYLLLYDAKVRRVIDAVTSSLVLILGRFTQERLEVLELIRSELRNRGYSPVLFNFEKPANRDLTEAISTLAHLARFVIADITDARSVPQELERIVPGLPSVPVLPILKAGSTEYAMFEHFKRYPWVLPVSEYGDSTELLDSLGRAIIERAEARFSEEGETAKNQPASSRRVRKYSHFLNVSVPNLKEEDIEKVSFTYGDDGILHLVIIPTRATLRFEDTDVILSLGEALPTMSDEQLTRLSSYAKQGIRRYIISFAYVDREGEPAGRVTSSYKVSGGYLHLRLRGVPQIALPTLAFSRRSERAWVAVRRRLSKKGG